MGKLIKRKPGWRLLISSKCILLVPNLPLASLAMSTSVLKALPGKLDMSRDMKFPTMWYVRPAKP